jgi:hypothetical protein
MQMNSAAALAFACLHLVKLVRTLHAFVSKFDRVHKSLIVTTLIATKCHLPLLGCQTPELSRLAGDE